MIGHILRIAAEGHRVRRQLLEADHALAPAPPVLARAEDLDAGKARLEQLSPLDGVDQVDRVERAEELARLRAGTGARHRAARRRANSSRSICPASRRSRADAARSFNA